MVRFAREAHAIAALNHPHISTLYDVGPNYLVMEYIEGKPLAGPLPLAEALAIAVQIADALDAGNVGALEREVRDRDSPAADVPQLGSSLPEPRIHRADLGQQSRGISVCPGRPTGQTDLRERLNRTL